MTTKVPKNSSPKASEDEDDGSGDEGMLSNEGRRRRFIIERKSEAPELLANESSSRSSKRLKLETGTQQLQQNIRRISYDRRPPGRRRRNNHQSSHHSKQLHNPNDPRQNFVYNNSNLRHIPLVNYSTMIVNDKEQNQPTPSQTTTPPSPPPPPPSPPKGPVVYINPKFIKRFVSKTIELANKSQSMNGGSIESTTTNTKKDNKKLNKLGVSKMKSNMIDEINLKTSPIESLRAASRMAIIRLVTECIETDSKRDETLNKILVSRLFESLCQQ